MKIMKKTLALTVAVMMLAVGIFVSNAATILYSSYCYYTIINNTSVSLTGWVGENPIVKVPSKLNKRNVTNIEPRAFYHDSTITGVDFSNADNLNTIGMYAFADCSAFSEPLVLTDTITNIGDCAFEGTPVPEVEINANTDYIPIQCFNGCQTLTQVTINGPVEEIDNYAFANCPNLEKVYLPQTVTFIANSAFNNDPNVTIYCYKDSYAKTYAESKSIPYVLIDGLKLGDVNRDGSVDVLDSIDIQKYTIDKIEFDEEQLSVADLNNDEEINVLDALIIQKYVVGKCDIPYIEG